MNNINPEIPIYNAEILWHRFISFIVITAIILVTLTVVIFTIGFIVDFKKRNKYTDALITKKIHYRTMANNTNSGEEYYARYWLWQINLKKALITTLINKYKIKRIYSRHAQQRKHLINSHIWFLKEVYGKIH